MRRLSELVSPERSATPQTNCGMTDLGKKKGIQYTMSGYMEFKTFKKITWEKNTKEKKVVFMPVGRQ